MPVQVVQFKFPIIKQFHIFLILVVHKALMHRREENHKKDDGLTDGDDEGGGWEGGNIEEARREDHHSADISPALRGLSISIHLFNKFEIFLLYRQVISSPLYMVQAAPTLGK